MDKVDPKLDCYGLKYMEDLSPCRDRCAVRMACRDAMRKKLRGDEVDQESISQTETEEDKPRRTLFPKISPFVMQVIQTMKTKGLQVQIREAYIAFKIDGRSIFHIKAFKAKSFSRLIRFIYTRNPDEFSDTVKPFVSEDRAGRFYVLQVKNFDELEMVLAHYLDSISGESQ